MHLQVFIPVTAVFILNNLVILTLEAPGYLIVNILSYGVVVSVSILSMKDLRAPRPREIPVNNDIDEVYDELKELLVISCQKDSLPIAKELARICQKLAERKAPKPNPFGSGALRRNWPNKYCHISDIA